MEGQYSNAKKENENISIEKISTTEGVLIETLIGEKKPVGMVDKRG